MTRELTCPQWMSLLDTTLLLKMGVLSFASCRKVQRKAVSREDKPPTIMLCVNPITASPQSQLLIAIGIPSMLLRAVPCITSALACAYPRDS